LIAAPWWTAKWQETRYSSEEASMHRRLPAWMMLTLSTRAFLFDIEHCLVGQTLTPIRALLLPHVCGIEQSRLCNCHRVHLFISTSPGMDIEPLARQIALRNRVGPFSRVQGQLNAQKM
jgi:hypothetical protein